jgi:hypothetical protein
MSSFILLYNVPPTPPGASHEGWPEWFQRQETTWSTWARP